MRLRLGLLRDTAEIDRMAAREAAEAQAKKHRHDIPALKETGTGKAKEGEKPSSTKAEEGEKEKPKPAPKPRIRPLSETKAIDRGASFISETFLFMVAGGLILFESQRSRNKESARRDIVQDRLNELEENEINSRRGLLVLEKEVLRLRAEAKGEKLDKHKRILPEAIWVVEDEEPAQEEPKAGLWGWVTSWGYRSTAPTQAEIAKAAENLKIQTVPATIQNRPEPEVEPSSKKAELNKEIPHKENLAERIAHEVDEMRKDATPPAQSDHGETEAVIDSTS
jgi:optic atrophy 3 protein